MVGGEREVRVPGRHVAPLTTGRSESSSLFIAVVDSCCISWCQLSVAMLTGGDGLVRKLKEGSLLLVAEGT